jgi:HlyD family secretion protein
MNRRTWVVAGLGAAAGVALVVWAFAPRPTEVEVAAVTQGRFETTIDEDGRTRLRERYTVSAPLAGRLSRITLREGDVVEADAVVATLTPVLPPMLDERTLREQQARVESAQANVQRALTRIERAKVSLEQARNEVRRTEQLAQQGFVSPNKLEGDRLAAMATQKELDASVEERHIASHDLEQARAALSAVRQPAGTGAGAGPGAGNTARAFAVRAPAAGRVLRVTQASEGTVALGTPLLELGDTARLEVVAELLTGDALQARPGSAVRIERWGGPTTLLGQVRRVEPSAFTKVSALGVEEQRVNVLIDITSPAEQWLALGDGFRVSVRIVTLTQDNAVLVPVSAVFPLPAGAPLDVAAAASGTPSAAQQPAQRWAVFTNEGGRAKVVPVVLGGRNGSHAWVREGVSPGASVIVYPPAAVRDGVRVAVRRV